MDSSRGRGAGLYTPSLVMAVRAIRNVADRTRSRSRIEVCRSARRMDFSCELPGSVIWAV